MRSFFRSFLVAFLTLCATQALTACGGLSEDNAVNPNAVVQVTTEIPSSNQASANNPIIAPVNNNQSEEVGVLNQGLDNTGLHLKMPLPAGYKWRVNTEAGTGNCGPQCVDAYHTASGYYSIDFGRSVKDNNNVQGDFGAGVVDVLAAAGGTLKSVVDVCDQGNPDCNGALPVGRTACSIEIDHGNGYTTKYLHLTKGTLAFTKAQGDMKNIWVDRGSYLGKMGNTGDSCGTAHLHFQVTYNGGSQQGNVGLSGITLEGIDFLDHMDNGFKVGQFRSSTNGFAYTPNQPYGVNPRVCANGLLIDPWTLDWTCASRNWFNLYRHVFSDVLVQAIQRDVCLRAEVWVAGIKRADAPQYCTSGVQPGNGLYYNNTNYFTTVDGSGQVKYFARNNLPGSAYLPAPFATVPFTVLSATPSFQPPPVNNLPTHQSAVKGPNAAFSWADQGSWGVTDHDMYFWYWNGSGWANIGWVLGWPSSNVTVSGLPTSKYIRWQVRSCGNSGCSKWSNATYFYLQP